MHATATTRMATFAPTWRMGQRPRMVEQAPDNEEPCLKCHADKRGPVRCLSIRRCGWRAARSATIPTVR